MGRRIAILAPPEKLDALRSVDGVAAHDVASLRKAIAGAEVVVLAPRYGAMLREVWDQTGDLKWVHSLGAGVETLPFDLLQQRDVVVTNSRGIYADALAEFVIAAMLWFAKDLRRLVTSQSRRAWEPFAVDRLEGATAGIIGYGLTGHAVARRAEAFGMRVVSLRRSGGTSLDELVPASDYIVISTPLTPETSRMFDARRIAQMRRSAVLINIGRGPVVDEQALIEALRSNAIKGAALDVFETEPLPSDSPLWSLENVLISPHSADRTADSHDRAVALFLDNLERFRRGEALQNVVDKRAGY